MWHGQVPILGNIYGGKPSAGQMSATFAWIHVVYRLFMWNVWMILLHRHWSKKEAKSGLQAPFDAAAAKQANEEFQGTVLAGLLLSKLLAVIKVIDSTSYFFAVLVYLVYVTYIQCTNVHIAKDISIITECNNALHWHHIDIALILHWFCIEIALTLHSNYIDMTLISHWHHSDIALTSHRHHIGITLTWLTLTSQWNCTNIRLTRHDITWHCLAVHYH